MIFYFNNKISNQKNNSKRSYYLQGYVVWHAPQLVPISNTAPTNNGDPDVWDTMVQHWNPEVILLPGSNPLVGSITNLDNPTIQHEFTKYTNPGVVVGVGVLVFVGVGVLVLVGVSVGVLVGVLVGVGVGVGQGLSAKHLGQSVEVVEFQNNVADPVKSELIS